MVVDRLRREPQAIRALAIKVLAAAAALFASMVVRAESFDWKILEGRWAESAEHAYACRSDNVHFEFEVDAMRSHLTFKLDRSWLIAGEQRRQYRATIVEAAGRMLVLRYGPELTGMPSDMREWELLFIGPGTYRWRATAWPAGRYNNVIGVRCPP